MNTVAPVLPTQSVENAALSLSWLASSKASGPDRQYHPEQRVVGGKPTGPFSR